MGVSFHSKTNHSTESPICATKEESANISLADEVCFQTQGGHAFYFKVKHRFFALPAFTIFVNKI